MSDDTLDYLLDPNNPIGPNGIILDDDEVTTTESRKPDNHDIGEDPTCLIVGILILIVFALWPFIPGERLK